MKQYVEADAMIRYLQELLDDFMEEKDKYGDAPMVIKHMNQMIACKEMVESLISEPVYLQKDGKVTCGF